MKASPQPIADLRVWRCGGRMLALSDHPLVMGILNVTPDSFSDGGCWSTPESARDRARAIMDEGADLLDIGGESTRPGSAPASITEERNRVLPLIEFAAGMGWTVSVDTMKAEVAREAVHAGACIINDVSAGVADPDMPPTAADSGAGLVLMHMQGAPATMQQAPTYRDVVEEVTDFLCRRIEVYLAAGADLDRLVVDPGIGFGKSLEHNLTLLRNLNRIKARTGCPVLVGLSRKRFLGNLTGRDVAQRLAASLGALAAALQRGADIFRVHDVKESCDVIKVFVRLGKEENRNGMVGKITSP